MKNYLQNRRALNIFSESSEPSLMDLAGLIADASKSAPVVQTVSGGAIDMRNSQVACLEGYLSLVQNSLHQFVLNPGFDSDIRLVFGNNVDLARARQLIQDFATQYSSSLPAIEIRAGVDINGAQGAYAAASDTIYLSAEFLRDNAANPGIITAVLLEEFGHALDTRLNALDTLGDEGELFSDLVQGQALSALEMQRILVEDDSVVVSMDNQTVILEQSTTNLGLWQGYGYLNDFINYGDPGDNWDFSIILTGVTSDYIQVSSSSNLVDLVLRLYVLNGNFIEANYDKNPADGNFEAISLANLPAGNYRATVFDSYNGYYLGYYNTYASYTLEINAPEIPRDRFESNDTLTSATPVSSGLLLPDGQRYFSNLTIGLSGTTVDADVFKFTTTRVATDADYILSFINGSGDIDLTLVDDLLDCQWGRMESNPIGGSPAGNLLFAGRKLRRNLYPFV